MNTDLDTSYPRKPDEISVVQIVLGIREYLKLLVSKWYWIALSGLLFASYNFYKDHDILTTYPAKATLLVKTNNTYKENSSAIKVFSRVATSQKIIESVLFRPITIHGNTDYLINYYITTFLTTKPEFFGEKFRKNCFFEENSFDKFSQEEFINLSLILERITKPSGALGNDGYITVSADDKLGFITLNISTPSELLSIRFIEEWKKVLEEHYLEYATFSTKGTFYDLKIETDTLRENFKQNYFELEQAKATYVDLVKKEELRVKDNGSQTGIREIKYLQKKINKLGITAEISKSDYLATLEKLKEAQKDLNDQKPLIKVTDQTTLPIKPYKPSAIVSAVKGGLMGVMLSIFIILALRVYRNIVTEAQRAEQELHVEQNQVG